MVPLLKKRSNFGSYKEVIGLLRGSIFTKTFLTEMKIVGKHCFQNGSIFYIMGLFLTVFIGETTAQWSQISSSV